MVAIRHCDIECTINPPYKAQFKYSGDIWFSFDDFIKFVADVQKLVAGESEAQLAG